MTLEDYQNRVKKLFGHGDMSYHLAKLLEESGELAKAVGRRCSRAGGSFENRRSDVGRSGLFGGRGAPCR